MQTKRVLNNENMATFLLYVNWFNITVKEFDYLALSPLLSVKSGRLLRIELTSIDWTEEIKSELLNLFKSRLLYEGNSLKGEEYWIMKLF